MLIPNVAKVGGLQSQEEPLQNKNRCFIPQSGGVKGKAVQRNRGTAIP